MQTTILTSTDRQEDYRFTRYEKEEMDKVPNETGIYSFWKDGKLLYMHDDADITNSFAKHNTEPWWDDWNNFRYYPMPNSKVDDRINIHFLLRKDYQSQYNDPLTS